MYPATTDQIQAVKALLDDNCLKVLQQGRCVSRISVSKWSVNFGQPKEGCWTCIRNYDLAKRIAELEL
jgi:hypothetical protein